MKTLLYTMIFSLVFLGTITVQAEEEILEPTLYTEEIPVPELVAGPMLAEEDLVIELTSTNEETEAPSSLGLWWTSVKENFVMAFTFNSHKRVEKALAFAEQRMVIAETFAQNAETEEEQARAEQMIEKAESFVKKADEQKLKVEEKIRERLGERKIQIEERKEKIQEYKNKKEELIEKIKEGNESAQEELQNLNQERKEEVQVKREEIKQIKVETQAQAQERREEMLVGGDKDKYGCIGSAGYTWCEGKSKCLRPFEDEWDETCQNERKEEVEPLNNMIQNQMQKAKGFLNSNQ